MTDTNTTVLSRLFDSRKFVVLLAAIAIVAISVFTGKATFEQFIDFLKWSVGAFAIATGLEGVRPSGGDTPPSAPTATSAAGTAATTATAIDAATK